jgi:hypothetical protein
MSEKLSYQERLLMLHSQGQLSMNQVMELMHRHRSRKKVLSPKNWEEEINEQLALNES